MANKLIPTRKVGVFTQVADLGTDTVKASAEVFIDVLQTTQELSSLVLTTVKYAGNTAKELELESFQDLTITAGQTMTILQDNGYTETEAKTLTQSVVEGTNRKRRYTYSYDR